MITNITQLSRFLPNTPVSILKEYVQPIVDTAHKYKINTPLRFSAFMAELAHESAGLRKTTENLNYSAERLLEVFPSKFKSYIEAKEYERHPEAIANRVYANRYGNGNEESGDGWRFRGRGPFQLTFRYNYDRYGKLMGLDLVNTPGLLALPEYGVLSAGAFWDDKKLNSLADKGAIKTITRRIAGSLVGYDDRLKLYQSALKIFSK